MAAYTVPAHQARIDAVFARAVKVGDLQLQADMARYLCVLVAGYLEQATRHILGNYTVDKAHPHIARYVERRLDKFTNANAQKLLDLIGSFNPEAGKRLEDIVDGERRDAIDSVVANRHEIAHGRDVGLTLIRISTYYHHVVDTIGMVEVEFA